MPFQYWNAFHWIPSVAAACDAGELENAEIDYLAKTAVMLTESFGKKQ